MPELILLDFGKLVFSSSGSLQCLLHLTSLNLTTLACCVGVPKHHICNANLMRNGADFAVYINTAQVGWGRWCSLTKFVLCRWMRWGSCSRQRARAAAVINVLTPLAVAYHAPVLYSVCSHIMSRYPSLPVKEFDGSDSGARPDEAISWGKIKIDAKPVKVRHANAW